MKWTGLNELRALFLEFFKSKQHIDLPSFPLVPNNDKSLLLINSGMAPMKNWFLGIEKAPNPRVTTCQKCVRTPDIENVGITERHGTFFEMLGNFSFQDYFKREAIEWAWEFFTSEEWLALPKEKLHISVYLEDDEAYDIWTKEIGVDPSHMVRLGKEDNFWEHGSGPCGPCSEIYFDRGVEKGCGHADCAVGCDCDRFMEVWNLVFSEFDSDGKGTYEKLKNPNIDTGMGLERLACVMQNVDNLFEVDTVKNILYKVEEMSGKTYKTNEKDDISIRVITDHIRASVFMVSDGVLPSNEGRGYVLRRLLRRAARHGRMLGINRLFLSELSQTVIEQNKGAYPELHEHKDYICKIIQAEEERFSRTIDKGTARLNELIQQIQKQVDEQGLDNTIENVKDKMKAQFKRVISGEDAFKLNDTYGFPLDLTREIAAEAGISIDEKAFKRELEKQREKARKDRLAHNIAGWNNDLFAGVEIDPTLFVGYDAFQTNAKVMQLSDGFELQDAITIDDDVKENVLVILDKTPFYAEGGGQVADTGTLYAEGVELEVQAVKKTAQDLYVHTCILRKGTVNIGQELTACVDKKRRLSIMRNHTGVHLLQQALREVLGEHVHQAGSYVDENRLRFDFTHFSAVSSAELEKVADIINDKIMEVLPVHVEVLPIEEAKKKGALALFGEKYTDEVRVIDISGWSMEFCGGTHVSNTGQLGSFKILTETSAAAGIRRIEAITGTGVLNYVRDQEETVHTIAKTLKVGNVNDLIDRTMAFMLDMKKAQQELESLKDQLANSELDNILKNLQQVEDIKVFTAFLPDTKQDTLRHLADSVKEKQPDGLAVMVASADGKTSAVVCCGKLAIEKGLSAGNVIKKVAAIAGGSGGGKPDFAMAGIKDSSKIEDMLKAVPSIVKEFLAEK